MTLTTVGGSGASARRDRERGDDAKPCSSSPTPAWERAKENVLPLARGRDVNKIGLVTKEGGGKGDELNIRKREHRAAIEAYDGNDPLSPWLTYLRDIRDEFSSDTQVQFELLEECARKFRNAVQYANDLRYVKVWISYADHLSNPSDVFKFLYKKGIGGQTAMFWIAWAYVAEVQGDYTLAERLYEKAENRKQLDDITLLRSRHSQFIRRMSRMWLNATSEDGGIKGSAISPVSRAAGGAETVEGGVSRKALETLSKAALRHNNRSAKPHGSSHQENSGNTTTRGDYPGNSQRRVGGLQSRTETRTQPSTRSSSISGNALPFAVFIEKEFEDETRSSAADHMQGGGGSRGLQRVDKDFQVLESAPPWEDLAPYASQNQENRPSQIEKGWAGGLKPGKGKTKHDCHGLPTRATACDTGSLEFPVFVEEAYRDDKPHEEATNLHVDQMQQHHEPKLSVRAKLDTMRESERLAKDPLFYMKDQGRNVKEQQPRSKKSTNAEEQLAPKNTGEQLPIRKRSVPEPKIVSVSQPQQQCKEPHQGDECQFEELRATLYRWPTEVADEDDTASIYSCMPHPTNVLMDDSFSPAGMVSRRPASPAAAPYLHKKRLMFTTANSSSPSASAAMPEFKMTGTDPCIGDDLTINTKVALDDLNSMFCSPGKTQNELEAEMLVAEQEKMAEQEEFQVFEDPEGEIGDALVREMHLYKDMDGYISGSGTEAGVVIVDENGLHQPNPHGRNLNDPGVEENVFCILEERPIEPMVYEEIEIVEDYCEEQPQQQQQPSQPTSGVRIRSGEKSGCNLSVMENLPIPSRRTNRDVIRSLIAGDEAVLEGEEEQDDIVKDPRTERSALEFNIYDDANDDGRRSSPTCKVTKSDETSSVAAKTSGVVSCAVTETEPSLTFTIFDDGDGSFGGADDNDGIMSFHQSATDERGRDGHDEMNMYGRPFRAELSCIQEFGTPTAEES